MNSQQLLDYIIKPTLEYMSGNYNSKNAQMLLLATAAIESKCGYYIKQIDGPALGVWQMEPVTEDDVWMNCDALKSNVGRKIRAIINEEVDEGDTMLIINPMYACAMARLKYSMDKATLPDHKEIFEIYRYYKRIYNTPLGASTFEKFKSAWFECELDKIVL
tara:strand:+ start:3610 stop:4095 length:486 start_codon:yes stop_codon:yes gene_type:complete